MPKSFHLVFSSAARVKWFGTKNPRQLKKARLMPEAT
jgi:hypothetical protein